MSSSGNETSECRASGYLELRGKDDLFRAAAERVVSELLADATAAAASSGALEDRLTEILGARFWRLYDLVHVRPHARELIDAKRAVAGDLFRAADDRFAALLDRTLAEATARLA